LQLVLLSVPFRQNMGLPAVKKIVIQPLKYKDSLFLVSHDIWWHMTVQIDDVSSLGMSGCIC
jgi:hypothetical protein